MTTETMDRAAAEAIEAYNAGGQCDLPGKARCVACFAERITESAAAHDLDAEALLAHAVEAIKGTMSSDRPALVEQRPGVWVRPS